jgi:hypothetical protein
MERRKTFSRSSFGSSIPIAFLPGTTATRAETADIERAMSSARVMTREDLTPGAGSISNRVMIGAGAHFLDAALDAEFLEDGGQALGLGEERVLVKGFAALFGDLQAGQAKAGASRCGGGWARRLSGHWWFSVRGAARRSAGRAAAGRLRLPRHLRPRPSGRRSGCRLRPRHRTAGSARTGRSRRRA